MPSVSVQRKSGYVFCNLLQWYEKRCLCAGSAERVPHNLRTSSGERPANFSYLPEKVSYSGNVIRMRAWCSGVFSRISLPPWAVRMR